MAHTLRSLVAAITLVPSILLAQANDPVKETSDGEMLLNPSTIVITGNFVTSPGPTTLELALRSIGQQIDRKRDTDATRSPLESLWKNPLWKFLPADAGGTLNSPVGALPDNLARTPLHLDDPFCTPAYLTFQGQRLDHDLTLSDKRELWFFGH
jgi:hypothetical protein